MAYINNNIVLMGMPGCGKSTLAENLALRLGWQWLDSDQEIEKQEGIGISEIFAQYGEGFFRRLETKCIRCLLQREDPAVISLGGGAVRNFVLSQDGGSTVQNSLIPVSLWQNCIMVYIFRSVEDILHSVDLSDRPLLKDHPEHIAELFAERHPLYEQVSHVRVHNDGTVDEGVDKIWEGLVSYRRKASKN